MVRQILIVTVVSYCVVAWLASPTWAAIPSFQGLGDLPGGRVMSFANGVSADGSVVVGRGASGSGFEAFRWTANEGMVGLGDLPGGRFFSEAHGVSADGSVIVGDSQSADSAPGFREGFIWNADTGMVGLGDLPGNAFSSSVFDISDDGLVVVGRSTGAFGVEAFRWTAGGGMVGLGDPFSQSSVFLSQAHAASADGSVIVGVASSVAYRWTAQAGMVPLGTGAASDVSADGSVVVGGINGEAFRWTVAGGMELLGDLPGGEFSSTSSSVSADGSFIMGFGNTDSGSEIFIWDEIRGMRSLPNLLLNEFGLDLAGWTLGAARAVSGDGRTIVGSGVNPNGFDEAWIITLPEPSSLGLLAVGGLAVTIRRRL